MLTGLKMFVRAFVGAVADGPKYRKSIREEQALNFLRDRDRYKNNNTKSIDNGRKR